MHTVDKMAILIFNVILFLKLQIDVRFRIMDL